MIYRIIKCTVGQHGSEFDRIQRSGNEIIYVVERLDKVVKKGMFFASDKIVDVWHRVESLSYHPGLSALTLEAAIDVANADEGFRTEMERQQRAAESIHPTVVWQEDL